MKNDELAKLKMDKVAIRIVTEQPFFATILMGLKRLPDPGCGAVWCDGVHIGFDADYVNEKAPGDLRTAPLDTLMGVVIHELYHVSALHHLRIMDMPNPELANRACDFAINHLIKRAGFKLPNEALDDKRFHDMPVEQIYKVLVKENPPRQGGSGGNQQPQKGGGQGGGAQQPNAPSPNFCQGPGPNTGGCGCVKPMPSPSGKEVMDKNERRQAEEEQIMRNKQASATAKLEGKLPGDMEREIDEQVKPVVAWRDVLARYVDEHMNANDYSYRRPNRRFANTDFYMPELRSPEMGTICLAMDTSGSISEEMLKSMVSECLDCLEAYVEQGQEPHLPVIYTDYTVQRVEMLSPGDKPHPRGGGGTRFSPTFEEVRKKADEWNVRAVVYMTDGYCADFGTKPDVPVLWILNGDGYNSNFNPPFGEVAIMKGSSAI